ncbi:Rab9 effector protein with kelch motifs-like protein [Tanacetum coccineum]
MGSLGNGEFKKAMWLYPRFMGFNPSERWGHSACFSNGFLYIFGGCCGGLHFSDVLVLNLETMAWVNLATTGAGPGPRDSHSAVIVGHMMIIFGGNECCKEKVNDIHILDLLTLEWTRPNCKGVAPTPRESHTATMIGHDRLVIFGGSGEGDANYLNDLHILDLKTMRWSSPEPQGDIPVPRDSHSAVTVDNKIFVYGGDCGDRYYGDVDVFNVDTLTWSRVYVSGGVGDKRIPITMFGSLGYILLFLDSASDTIAMHTKRRRMSNSKACEVIESEPEEHSLSLSQHSSPTHSDQERTLVKQPSDSTTQVLPLFKNQNQIPSTCKQTPGTQSNPITILSHKQHQNSHAVRPKTRNFEPMRVQNLIGAEVHGKVDGAFDSGYLMTATVLVRIFGGSCFPPGPEVVSRGTFRGHKRRSPTNHVAQRNLHINRAFIRHSNHTPAPHPPEPSHRGYAQDHVHRPSPVVRSVPGLSLGIERQSELHGVVLTLGGPGSGHG